MNLNVGETVCGFTLKRRRENAEIKGTLWEFTHEKTGAGLCWVDNKAENKLFSVAFKTTPKDDSGVFHILEHSVLNGSERYPVKEPFVELLKSSMNTFLNAMTYPDKTVYPVSSRNEKDFLNLTSVYLDAVWRPLLQSDKCIFLQEGIRLETDGKPRFNGVVLNEMKGAMSEVDSVIEDGLDKLLFPDTCYGYNSGGDPKAVAELTYGRFRDTYREFYHPSNALFCLDGDLPLEKTLTLIDGYLKTYGVKTDLPRIAAQVPRAGKATVLFDAGDGGAGSCLVFGKILGTYDETERMAAASVLCDLLTFSNDAPLKKAVLRKGLAEDVELYVSDGVYQPYLTLIFRNIAVGRENEIRDTARETALKLAEDGISEADLVASVNRLEFNSRQTPEPQALSRMSEVLDSWLYGGDPMMFLDRVSVFRALREKAEIGGYEELLAEMFDGRNTAELRVLPEKGLSARAESEELARASKVYGALTEDEKAELSFENAELRCRQETPDSGKALALLPRLSLSDVSKEPPRCVTEAGESGGCRTLYHPCDCNGITYFSLYAPLCGFTLDEISLLSVLCELYAELPVSGRSLVDLQRNIKTYLGDLSFDVTVFSPPRETESCTPCFAVSASALCENTERAQSLAAEVLLNTDISDRAEVRRVILQIDEKNRRDAVASGNLLAASVARSSFSAAGAVRDAVSGFGYIRAVHAFAERFDEYFERLLRLKARLENGFLCRENVTLSVTAERPAELSALAGSFPRGEAVARKSAYASPYPERVGIKIPAAVSFAVKGIKYAPPKGKTPGEMSVLANLLTYSYLWDKIRVRGGAYGAGFDVSAYEGFLCYSYRDPSPAASLNIYDGAARFTGEFARGDESLERYVISTVAGSEPLMAPWQYGAMADRRWFTGVDEALIRQIREETLATDKGALLAYVPALEQLAGEGCVCVAADGDALKTCSGLTVFDL